MSLKNPTENHALPVKSDAVLRLAPALLANNHE
jgi:hypothetical protein